MSASKHDDKNGSTHDARAPRRRRKLGYPVILAIIIGVGALLVVRSSFSGGTYSLEIAKVRAEPARFLGHDLKIVGKVKPGSIHTKQLSDHVELHFTIDDGKGNELAVMYPHSAPDPFKAGRQVIVEGTLESKSTVTCSKLTVKCPSKYVKEGDGAGKTQQYYREKYGMPKGGPTS